MKKYQLTTLVLFIIFLVLLALNLSGQTYEKKTFGEFMKQRIPSVALIAVAGVADAYAENVTWHYYRDFKATYPNANDTYFNPRKSWVRKYKNGDPMQGARFPGSTTYLKWTTEFNGLMRTTTRWSLLISTPINLKAYENIKGWYIFAEAAIKFLTFAIVWHGTDKLILQNNAR